MSLFDSLVKKVKSNQEENRYAQAYPKQYYNELKERADKQKEKDMYLKKARDIKYPVVAKAREAGKSYVNKLKTNKVQARIQSTGRPGGVFGTDQVDEEQKDSFIRTHQFRRP